MDIVERLRKRAAKNNSIIDTNREHCIIKKDAPARLAQTGAI